MSTGVESSLQPQSLQGLVDSLAERLQRSVALDDPTISLIVASRHFGDEDAARVQSVLGRGVDPAIRARVLALGIAQFEGPRRLPPMTDFGAKARVCVPVRCTGVLLGYLWLIDDGHITDDDLRELATVADMAGMILYRRDLIMQRRQARASALVRDLICADEPTRAAAELEAIDEGLVDPGVTVRVSVLRPAGDAGDEPASALAHAAQHATSASTDPAILCLPRPRDLVVLSAHGHKSAADAGLGAARRVTTGAADQLDGPAITGIGGEQAQLRSAHRSYQQALTAIRAAQFLPGLGDVVAWDSLGVYALLAKLDADDLDLAARATPLARLAASRNGDVLLATAETFLDLAGSVQRTAEALHVHRATLYQRLARIEEVTGMHLDDGGDRLTLHLGIKLARLTGGLPG